METRTIKTIHRVW